MTSASPLLIGITGNSVVHTDTDRFDLETRFRMVSEAGVFDYYERTPPPHEIDLHLRMSERYQLPIRAGGFIYRLERDEPLLDWHLRIGSELGAKVQNVQLLHRDANGVPVSNARVAAAYLHAWTVGAKVGVTPCFEVHVDTWSEHFGRVEEVARLVEREGVPFNITLDPSHVIFKIGNTGEQQAQDMLADVQSGRVRLDPYAEDSVIGRWISGNLVGHAHARPAVPNNPVNVWSSGPNGEPGRGIQYPFGNPPAGSWHGTWNEAMLEPWKHVMRTLLAYHARTPSSRLGHVSTEILPFHDYGAGSRYSLFDDSVACARWLRETWTDCLNNQARGVESATCFNLPNGTGLAGRPATTGAQK